MNSVKYILVEGLVSHNSLKSSAVYFSDCFLTLESKMSASV